MSSMQPGTFVVCPTGRGCGIDMSYFTAEFKGVVIGLTPDGNVRVDWEGDEVRHFHEELVTVDTPITSDQWTLQWPLGGEPPASDAMIRALGHCGQCDRLIAAWNEQLAEPNSEVCDCPD